MARLCFVAPGHDHQACETFGRQFPHGVWVEAADMAPAHLAILAENPTFEVDLNPPGEARPASRRQGGSSEKAS